MSSKETSDAPQKDQGSVDLSSLQELSFGPSWGATPGSMPGKDGGKSSSFNRGNDRSRGRERRSKDRRQGGVPAQKRKTAPPSEPFKPLLELMFYPEDEPFDKLTKSIRQSCITYELFEIAHAILEKTERFVIVMKPFASKQDAEPKRLYVSKHDGLPFLSEEAAIAHATHVSIEQYFDTEAVEVEAPKGNFPFVNKCPKTAVLLGPPNYHRYQTLLKEHHASKVAHIPFDKYQNQLEKVSDEAVVQEWLKQMSTQTRYKWKSLEGEASEAAPEAFDSLEAARFYLLQHKRDALIDIVDTARMHGTQITQLKDDGLKRSVESELERQRKFPLDTANNLRGRMRRMKFNIYKKGAKGVSYVTAVKRKFRDEKTVFSDPAQALIDFIEKHPKISVKALPESYLGITPPKQAGEDTKLSVEEDAKLKACMRELKWLVAEGYVTEFGNGTLFAPPPMTQPAQSQPAEQPIEAPTSDPALKVSPEANSGSEKAE